MLHIIQSVLWGAAEAPLVFLDRKKAREAYVDSTRKQWAQRYAAYCEHHGLNGDDFGSAQAFVQTIDVTEKSSVHYWTVEPEGTGHGSARPGADDFREIATEVGTVKAGLTRLLADVSNLADICTAKGAALAEARTGEERAATEKQTIEADSGSYTTREWKEFAATVKRHLCGENNQSALLSRHDWRQDVYSSLTSLEYWDWVADRARRYRDEAEQAGYVVVAEPGVLGSFRIAEREGDASEERYGSEWEAWCAAGQHLRARNAGD